MQRKPKIVLYVVVIPAIIMTAGFMCGRSKINNLNPIENTTAETTETTETIKTIDIETDKGVDTDKADMPVSLGEFRLTAYCSCAKCCGKWASNRPNGVVVGAIGEELKAGYSIAVDPTVIPYRTEVIINGHTYKAQDCGGAIKGNRIDIYFDSHSEALKFGVKYTEVFMVQK